MSRIILAILVVVAVLCGACGAPSGQEPTPTPTPGPKPKPPTDWSADGIIKAEEYFGQAKYGDFEIYWVSDEQYVFVGMRAKTTGWVAVGIQPDTTKKMKDADMVFGSVREGKTSVYDLFGTGTFGPHPEDTELGGTNDILEFGGNEENGYTTIELSRALVTGDKHDNELVNGKNQIMWSYGKDGFDELPPSFSTEKHVKRGYGELDLSQ